MANIPIIGGDTLPAGQVNMGDMRMLDQGKFDDKVFASEKEVALPVTWEVMDVSETKQMHRPVLQIEGLARYELDWRDTPEFFEGERQMFVMVFANVCANYLFGEDLFLEKKKGIGVQFKPNPRFAKLDFKPVPKSQKEKQAIEAKEIKGEIPESLLPLTILDAINQEHESTLTVTEVSNLNDWHNNMPKAIELKHFKANGELMTSRKYKQVVK